MPGSQNQKTKELWELPGFWWVVLVSFVTPILMISTIYGMFRLGFDGPSGAFTTIGVMLLEFAAAGLLVMRIADRKVT